MYGKVLVTGSSGHLGEALVSTLQARGHAVVGVDLLPGAHTHRVGTIADRAFVREAMAGVDVVLHPATLHKPHVATHSRQEFIDTNLTGTLNLLEEAVAGGVRAFVYTSTTSVFGDALVPPPGEPAAWITEDVRPEPKNIYGVTKAAAEDLCQLFQRNQKLPCIVLRTSRFFAEEDDDRRARESFSDANLKANEFLYRRRAPARDRTCAHAGLRPLHRQRHHALRAGGHGAAARRHGGRAARPRTGIRTGIRAARLASAGRHRSRLRQRAGARGTGLAAAA